MKRVWNLILNDLSMGEFWVRQSDAEFTDVGTDLLKLMSLWRDRDDPLWHNDPLDYEVCVYWKCPGDCIYVSFSRVADQSVMKAKLDHEHYGTDGNITYAEYKLYKGGNVTTYNGEGCEIEASEQDKQRLTNFLVLLKLKNK